MALWARPNDPDLDLWRDCPRCAGRPTRIYWNSRQAYCRTCQRGYGPGPRVRQLESDRRQRESERDRTRDRSDYEAARQAYRYEHGSPRSSTKPRERPLTRLQRDPVGWLAGEYAVTIKHGRWAGRATQVMRALVLARDEYRCQIPGADGAVCGAPATQADHITPRAQGGLNVATNMRAACGPCNVRRGLLSQAVARVRRYREATDRPCPVCSDEVQ